MLLETDPNQIPETPSHVRNVEEEKYNLHDSKSEQSHARTDELLLDQVCDST
jgi:hypothetical protein